MTGPSSLNFNFWKNDILWYCMLHATCKGIVTKLAYRRQCIRTQIKCGGEGCSRVGGENVSDIISTRRIKN